MRSCPIYRSIDLLGWYIIPCSRRLLEIRLFNSFSFCILLPFCISCRFQYLCLRFIVVLKTFLLLSDTKRDYLYIYRRFPDLLLIVFRLQTTSFYLITLKTIIICTKPKLEKLTLKHSSIEDGCWKHGSKKDTFLQK